MEQHQHTLHHQWDYEYRQNNAEDNLARILVFGAGAAILNQAFTPGNQELRIAPSHRHPIFHAVVYNSVSPRSQNKETQWGFFQEFTLPSLIFSPLIFCQHTTFLRVACFRCKQALLVPHTQCRLSLSHSAVSNSSSVWMTTPSE